MDDTCPIWRSPVCRHPDWSLIRCFHLSILTLFTSSTSLHSVSLTLSVSLSLSLSLYFSLSLSLSHSLSLSLSLTTSPLPPSFSPLLQVDALICAMNHSATLSLEATKIKVEKEGESAATRESEEHGNAILNFTKILKSALHNTFRYRTVWIVWCYSYRVLCIIYYCSGLSCAVL